MSNIPINSGTGPGVAVDLVGTDNYQVVKLMLAGTGATTGIATVLPVSGTMAVSSIITGTMNVVNVLSASGVTVASVSTGTFSISNTPNFVLTTTTLGAAGGFVMTAHASRFQGFVIATTSAAGGVIVVTSGANTLYITDVLISVTGALNVALCSETTVLAQLYLVTGGGWAQSFISPIKCNSAQSARVVLSSSGAAAISIQGYTVT